MVKEFKIIKHEALPKVISSYSKIPNDHLREEEMLTNVLTHIQIIFL